MPAQFRVIAWDAPGYGASTPLAIDHSNASHYAPELDAFLAALGIDHCHVLGHSLGTLISAQFAAKQPKRIVSLTLANIARARAASAVQER